LLNNIQFATPILMMNFNRPSHTRKVLDEIKQHCPKTLYLFQDGARAGNEADSKKCSEVRSILNEVLDWNCNCKTYFSDINLGCGLGPKSAITWFFENEEQGIVIEDDCLPHPDFFPYCEELLEKYRENPEVMFIGATTYHDLYPCNTSYFFTKHPVVGAWAAWRRTWTGYDFDLYNLNEENLNKELTKQLYSKAERKWWIKKLKEIKSDTQKTYWDFQFHIHLYLNHGVAVMPKRNMISNIGFDAEGTHTTNNSDGRGARDVFPCYPLVHPTEIRVDVKDEYLYLTKVQQKSLNKRILISLHNYMFESEGVLNKILLAYKQKKKEWKNL
jgi:hypothetical protein